jgi:hypothetical protein
MVQDAFQENGRRNGGSAIGRSRQRQIFCLAHGVKASSPILAHMESREAWAANLAGYRHHRVRAGPIKKLVHFLSQRDLAGSAELEREGPPCLQPQES